MKGLLHRPLGWVCAGAGTLAIAAVPVAIGLASGGADAVGASFSARAVVAAKAELGHVSGPGKRAPRIVSNAPASAGATQAGYYNWSGYADSSTTAGEFSTVSGSWTVPAVTCTSEDRVQSEWVGFDGLTDNTVEQAGTISQCFEGTPLYYTWWQMWPTQSNSQIVGTTVKPGDHITALVRRTGTTYKLTVTDATTSGNNVSETQTCAATTCLAEDADWIVERNTFASTGYAPLPPFKTTSFSAASETAGGVKGTINSVSPNQIFMVDSTDSYDLATPAAVSSTGRSFRDQWNNSY
jgi:Peptidase A4 family